MVTVLEGINKIVENKKELKTMIIPLENALGKISATTIKATISLPRFDNSAMDGFAVNGDSESYKIVGKILAGDDIEINLQTNECVKITTGAKIPKNSTAIIPQENCEIFDDFIKPLKEIKPNQNIRFCGEDIKIGESVINRGDKITSNYIQLLSSQGVTHIKVFQPPRVAVFASGSELKMPYEKLENAQIYNSNTPYFISRLKELGCEVVFIGKSGDDLKEMKEVIKNALNFDLIITSGGISVGEADFTKEAFLSFEFESIFEKVKIKPGKPTTFGKVGDTFVLNLPGNPLAASLNFEIFGKVLINTLNGTNKIYHNFIKTKLDKTFLKNKPVTTVVPGFFDGESFKVLEKFGPNMVNVLNHANTIMVVDENTTKIGEGDEVKILPFNWKFYSKSYRDFFN